MALHWDLLPRGEEAPTYLREVLQLRCDIARDAGRCGTEELQKGPCIVEVRLHGAQQGLHIARDAADEVLDLAGHICA